MERLLPWRDIPRPPSTNTDASGRVKARDNNNDNNNSNNEAHSHDNHLREKEQAALISLHLARQGQVVVFPTSLPPPPSLTPPSFLPAGLSIYLFVIFPHHF